MIKWTATPRAGRAASPMSTAAICRMAAPACTSKIAGCNSPTPSMKSPRIVGRPLIDEEPHLDRLERSLRELGMAMPMGRAALKLVMREMIARNRVEERLALHAGDARRGRGATIPFPTTPLRPTLIMTARRQDPELSEKQRQTRASP